MQISSLPVHEQRIGVISFKENSDMSLLLLESINRLPAPYHYLQSVFSPPAASIELSSDSLLQLQLLFPLKERNKLHLQSQSIRLIGKAHIYERLLE